MESVKITTEYIKLDQFLKWAGVTDSGADAKILIAEGKILVNGEVALQRGKKIRPGDTVSAGKTLFKVE
jgi:ribosome-associated protein